MNSIEIYQLADLFRQQIEGGGINVERKRKSFAGEINITQLFTKASNTNKDYSELSNNSTAGNKSTAGQRPENQ